MTKSTVQRRWSIEKRLEFIDFQLFWNGKINRSDIREQFGVSVPQASNDLSQYDQFAPGNLSYDPREKKYFSAPSFKPAFFKPDADSYLWQMRDDVHSLSGAEGIKLSDLPTHDIVRTPRRNIDSNILRSVVAAIQNSTTLQIFYQSMSSTEPTWRTISPHSFAFDGMRWHARAYCHSSKRYKDFLLSRIQRTAKKDDVYVSSDNDLAWNEIFILSLKPHPKLSASQANAVAQDYNMHNLRLRIEIRLALLYYFLRRLELQDCDGEARNSREQHVVVANKEETRAALKRAS